MAVFTIQENLSEKQRVKLLLFKKDDPVQQSYVFQNARNIFRDNLDSIQDEIIPLILENIVQCSEYIQIHCGDMFALLIRERILSEQYKPKLK